MKTHYRVTLRRGPHSAPPVVFRGAEPAVQFAVGCAAVLDGGRTYSRADCFVAFGRVRRRPAGDTPRVDSATVHEPGAGAGWAVTLERVRLGVPGGR